MTDPTSEQREAADAYVAADRPVSGPWRHAEGAAHVVGQQCGEARGSASERAKIADALAKLSEQPPAASVNPTAFALQVECMRAASNLVRTGKIFELPAVADAAEETER